MLSLHGLKSTTHFFLFTVERDRQSSANFSHYLPISHTDLSDLSIVCTCILVYKLCHKVIKLPNWLIHFCYQPESSRITETASITWPCAKCFQKCSSVEIIIYHFIAKFCNTNHCDGLAIKGDLMSTQIIYSHSLLANF